MIGVSALLRRGIYPVMSRVGAFARRVRAGEVCVLTYHGVLPEGWNPVPSPIEGTLLSAEEFRRQLLFLKSRYNLISPEEFHSWLNKGATLPPRAVLLTCDDGLLNVLTDMIPILQEEGARCLFFVTGAALEETSQRLWYEDLFRMLDQAPGEASVKVGGETRRKDSLGKGLVAAWWKLVLELSGQSCVERKRVLGSLRSEWGLSDQWRTSSDERAERRYGLLNRQQLRELVTQGMTVGAHTMSHPALARMSVEQAEREIQECKTRLESFLQQEVWALAFPFGDEGSAGAREMKLAEQAGYACAFLNYGGGLSRRTTPRFGLPRAHVTAHMDLPELDAHLSGFHQTLQQRFRGGGGTLSCA